MDFTELTIYNKNILKESIKCGCYACISEFDYSEIFNFVDGERTALCPYCYIDSVIPMKDFTIQELKKLNKENFGCIIPKSPDGIPIITVKG